MNRIGERMSKEARPGHQPPLNIPGCVALLNAIRTFERIDIKAEQNLEQNGKFLPILDSTNFVCACGSICVSVAEKAQ
jgi:hypothetical protein